MRAFAKAQSGDSVKVHYVCRLKEGAVCDNSFDREPIVFRIGEHKFLRSFETAVIGMSPGETKVITLPPEEAYGVYSDDMVIAVDRAKFASSENLEPGASVDIGEMDGPVITVRVVSVGADTVTLDGNHPLAGCSLVFEIKLLEILSVICEN